MTHPDNRGRMTSDLGTKKWPVLTNAIHQPICGNIRDGALSKLTISMAYESNIIEADVGIEGGGKMLSAAWRDGGRGEKSPLAVVLPLAEVSADCGNGSAWRDQNKLALFSLVAKLCGSDREAV